MAIDRPFYNKDLEVADKLRAAREGSFTSGLESLTERIAVSPGERERIGRQEFQVAQENAPLAESEQGLAAGLIGDLKKRGHVKAEVDPVQTARGMTRGQLQTLQNMTPLFTSLDALNVRQERLPDEEEKVWEGISRNAIASAQDEAIKLGKKGGITPDRVAYWKLQAAMQDPLLVRKHPLLARLAGEAVPGMTSDQIRSHPDFLKLAQSDPAISALLDQLLAQPASAKSAPSLTEQGLAILGQGVEAGKSVFSGTPSTAALPRRAY